MWLLNGNILARFIRQSIAQTNKSSELLSGLTRDSRKFLYHFCAKNKGSFGVNYQCCDKEIFVLDSNCAREVSFTYKTQ